MALEMKIYKEIAGYEAKAMFGRSWRQLAALTIMAVGGGSVFALATLLLLSIGKTLDAATSIAMYLMFPILIPAAAWGWWRPKGLKPEQFLGFFLRHHLMKRHIHYEDTYQLTGKPLSVGTASQSAKPRTQRQLRRATKKLEKIITEHPAGQKQKARRRAR